MLISFFNVDVFISRLIMSTIFFLSLRERCDLASLFSCNMSTSLAITLELALLWLMQFIVVWSFSRFTLSCMKCSFSRFVVHVLWLFFLTFSFFNVDIFISRSIMLTTFFLSLHKHFNLASLFSYDELTLLAIIFESALLQFMQFIII